MFIERKLRYGESTKNKRNNYQVGKEDKIICHISSMMCFDKPNSFKHRTKAQTILINEIFINVNFDWARYVLFVGKTLKVNIITITEKSIKVYYN